MTTFASLFSSQPTTPRLSPRAVYDMLSLVCLYDYLPNGRKREKGKVMRRDGVGFLELFLFPDCFYPTLDDNNGRRRRCIFFLVCSFGLLLSLSAFRLEKQMDVVVGNYIERPASKSRPETNKQSIPLFFIRETDSQCFLPGFEHRPKFLETFFFPTFFLALLWAPCFVSGIQHVGFYSLEISGSPPFPTD